MELIKECRLCPRECRVNRYESKGFCGAGSDIKAALASLHYMEEPCISGNNQRDVSYRHNGKEIWRKGSGTIFF